MLELRSDNGSNFVGAKHELAKAIENWKKQKSMIFCCNAISNRSSTYPGQLITMGYGSGLSAQFVKSFSPLY